MPAVVSAVAAAPAFLTSVSSVYTRVSSSVVGISCRRGRDRYVGSGAVIDPSGLIITSVTVVPRGARDLEVYLRGGRMAEADIVVVRPKKELSVITLREPDRFPDLSYLRLGRSEAVSVGDTVFTLGNSYRSIERDDRVSVAVGVVSGTFPLTETRDESRYLGPAIETTAALNNGVDGGPLVNLRGEIIGILSLNYSRQRWLGTAVPIDILKPIIAEHRGWFDDVTLASSSAPAYAGVELEEVAGREIRVLRVAAESPAREAGLERGDAIIAYNGEPLGSLDDFRRLFESARPGTTARWTIERDGESHDIRLTFWGRF